MVETKNNYEEYGDDNKTGVITKRFAYADELWAWKNNISGIALPLLNFIIHNWIAGIGRKLRQYDDENNNKFEMSMYAVSRVWKIRQSTIADAMKRLRALSVKILDEKIVGKIDYLGLNINVIPEMLGDSKLRFINQCVYWERLDILKILEDTELKPLIDLELNRVKDNKKRKAPEWAENVIKEICLLAKKENVYLNKNGKDMKLFSHLDKKNEFKIRRKTIDDACFLVDDLYSGYFWRNNPNLFCGFKKNVLQFKQVDLAIKKIKNLQGNKDGLKKFLLRCAKNYFIAIQPGMDTYKQIKSSFPVNVKDFILFNDYRGNAVPNFLLYYSPVLNANDNAINDTIAKINKAKLPEDVYDKLDDYGSCVTDSQQLSYWLNVRRLVETVQSEIKNRKTSYSPGGCFDIIFRHVDDRFNYFKTIQPGYFDIGQQTMTNAFAEIRNK